MHRLILFVVLAFSGLTSAAPLPKADPKRTWVGKSVVIKSSGTEMTVLRNGTTEQVPVNIINPVVLAEDEDSIEIHVQGITGRLKKTDVVRTDDGIEYFTKKLDEKLNIDLLVRRASVYRLRNEFESALTDYDAALSLNRGAALLQNRGSLHLVRRDFDKALADFSESVQILPTFHGGYCSRGVVYEATNQYPEAMKDYEKANELGIDATVVLGMGRVYALQEKYKEALGKFDEAIEINSKFTSAFTSRGTAYFELNMPKKARDDMDKAIELAPQATVGWVSRAWLNLKLGDHRSAASDAAEAVRLDDTDPGALNMRAWVLSVCPDDDYRNGKKALELAKKAVRLTEEKNPMYLDTLACVHAEIGDFKEAVELSRKALEFKNQLNRKRTGEIKARLALFEANKPYRELPKK
jgi:tetratricopeptide (TPR) repeat protein